MRRNLVQNASSDGIEYRFLTAKNNGFGSNGLTVRTIPKMANLRQRGYRAGQKG